MRFTSFIAATLAASFGSALPAPTDVDIIPRALSKTYYSVSDFHVATYPKQQWTTYFFSVQSHSPSSYRRFGYADCQVEIKESQITPVTLAECSGNNVYFSLTKYLDEYGSFAGWKFSISHPYHNKAGFLTVDGASRKFPKSEIETKGSGKNLHHQLGGPHSFKMNVSK